MKPMQFNRENQLFTMKDRKIFEKAHGKRKWARVNKDGKSYYRMLNKTTTTSN